MAQPKVIEGTWDEIAAHAQELRAYPRLTLIVPTVDVQPLTEAEWEELEAELTEGIDPALSPLSEEALSRTSIYGERA